MQMPKRWFLTNDKESLTEESISIVYGEIIIAVAHENAIAMLSIFNWQFNVVNLSNAKNGLNINNFWF